MEVFEGDSNHLSKSLTSTAAMARKVSTKEERKTEGCKSRLRTHAAKPKTT